MYSWQYSFGNEHSPTDPFGACDLTVDENGDARLEHRQRTGEARIWTAQVDQKVQYDLTNTLGKTNFPEQVQTFLIPDEVVYRLKVGDEAMDISGSTRKSRPEYATILDMLDSLIYQMSNGSIGSVESILPEGSVQQIQQL